MAVITRQVAFDEETLSELRDVLNRLRDPEIRTEDKLHDMAVALQAMGEFLDTLNLPN